MIGHVPFTSNSHHEFKEGKSKTFSSIRVVEGLRDVIRKFSDRIDLYMCADEHNQQYITLPGMPPEVISGSGGAILDIYIRKDEDSYVYNNTHFARAAFGFVAVVVDKSKIQLSYYGQFDEEPLEVFVTSISKDERHAASRIEVGGKYSAEGGAHA